MFIMPLLVSLQQLHDKENICHEKFTVEKYFLIFQRLDRLRKRVDDNFFIANKKPISKFNKKIIISFENYKLFFKYY